MSPDRPTTDRILRDYVRAQRRMGMERGDELKRGAERIGNLRVYLLAIVGLVLAGATGAAFLTSLARADDVEATIAAHESSESPHAPLAREVRGVTERLIRVEEGQRQLRETQDRIEDKLDRALLGLPLAPRPAAYPPATTP